ncbi:hypothetical protein, conserved [Plasmodium gonderi]|uniref:S1 motif domain-containing protein n=1 Tax=Plasmodium gonderi TaxID=77519 RepID=A0A1Y1JBK7_PLAGO|nr:hypothetical protein, conserved [Plasmodium gonderi]GAW79630.1 hypothetical protein, conserved [Plasmodium gonderi]
MKVIITTLVLCLVPIKCERSINQAYIMNFADFPLQPSTRQAKHTWQIKKIRQKKKKNCIYISGNDLFEYFATLTNEEDDMDKEKKKRKKNYSVSYLQKLPKKKLLLKRWKYDMYEKIKEKIKNDQELINKTKICGYKFKLPIDFFKLGSQIRGKIVNVQNHLIKIDVNAINFAHLYIKRYFEEKTQVHKKYQVGKYIDVVICYIHKKNGIIQVTDNEEEIKILHRSLRKLRDSGYLPKLGESSLDHQMTPHSGPNLHSASPNGTLDDNTMHQQDDSSLRRTSDSFVDTASDSFVDTASDSLADSASNPLADSASDSLADSASNPLADSASDPLADSASDPLADSASDPVADPIHPEDIKKKLGVSFQTNDGETDLMYIKEENIMKKRKKITDFKIEDTVGGVIKFINEEGAYIDIGCETLAFLNLGHYNKDPKYMFKDVKKKKLKVSDYIKNLKIRKIDIFNNRIEVTIYNMQEEACLRILNQQETLKEQNKYMPCSSFIVHNYHMINYLKKYNELKKKKKKNIHNLFEKKEQLNELKNVTHLKKSQFTPFMLRYNELTTPNNNYEDMIEQNADNEQFLKEIGVFPNSHNEQGNNKFNLELLRKQNKSLKEEINRFRESIPSDNATSGISRNYQHDEPKLEWTEKQMHHNLNPFFTENAQMLNNESTTNFSSHEYRDEVSEENQNFQMEEESDDIFHICNDNMKKTFPNKQNDSTPDGNKQTLQYLKQNIKKIKESVMNEGVKKENSKLQHVHERNGNVPYDVSRKLFDTWNKVVTEDTHKIQHGTFNQHEEQKDPSSGDQCNFASYLDEGDDDGDEDEEEEGKEAKDDFDFHRDLNQGEGKKKFAGNPSYIEEKKKKKKMKKKNIFLDDEHEPLDEENKNSGVKNENRYEEVNNYKRSEDDFNSGDENDDYGTSEESEEDFLNVKKHLKYIISQNVSMSLPHNEEKCIEEASKLFGDDIKTWDEKMYYYFGDRDNVSLDGFDIYDQDEFKINTVNNKIQEFSEYDKILDSHKFNGSSDIDLMGAKYGDDSVVDATSANDCQTSHNPIETRNSQKDSQGSYLDTEEVDRDREKGYGTKGENIICAYNMKMDKQIDDNEGDLENYMNTFLDDEDDSNEQTYEQMQVKKQIQNDEPILHPPKEKRKDKKINPVKDTNERSTILNTSNKGIKKSDTNQLIDLVHREQKEDIENAVKSSSENQINVSDILNKAIRIGDMFRRKELEKLLQRRKAQTSNRSDCYDGTDSDEDSDEDSDGDRDEDRDGGRDHSRSSITREINEHLGEGPMENFSRKPFLRVSRIARQGNKEGESAKLKKNEEEEEESKNAKRNCMEDVSGSNKRNTHDNRDDMKLYKHASYDVQGYYKRKRKVRNIDDLEAVDSENNDDLILNNNDFLDNNANEGTENCDSYRDNRDDGAEKRNGYPDEIHKESLKLDQQMDMFFLLGKNDKITQGNYLEKLLTKEKIENKGASKEIDMLLQHYRYVNEHPDEFIKSFYNENGETNKSADFLEENFTDIDKKQKHIIEKQSNSIANSFNIIEREGDPRTKQSKQRTHETIANYMNTKSINAVETELNHMSNESLALRSWSLKLGLIKEKDMHLDDQSLINHFISNPKFKRALKYYNIKNTKNVTIPLIYKMTKLLYFERPFPRKEQNRKLNMN